MVNKDDKHPFDEDTYTHNIDRNNARSLDRRGFMKTLVGSAGLFALSTLPWGTIAAKRLILNEQRKFPKQKIGRISEIAVGESIDFAYPKDHEGALLIRLKKDHFVAYQNACTHLQCPVFWQPDSGDMICPCHHGVFDVTNGDAIAGPPTRALPEIELQIEDGIVYAVGVKAYET